MKKPPHYDEVPEGGMLHMHFLPRLMETIIDQAKKYEHIVIPLRHPVAIALSWRQRNQSMHDLKDEIMALEGCLEHFDAFIFPVEMPKYDELEAYLGRKIYRDPPITRWGTGSPYEAKRLWKEGKIDALLRMRHWAEPTKYGLELLEKPLFHRIYNLLD